MPPAGEPPHILILGGTGEAYALAEALAERADLRVTSSLAGATAEPRLPAGVHRIGGFGGTEGLARYLEEQDVALVVDASHPFASQISAQAAAATAATSCLYRRLERPPWTPVRGDRWHPVPSIEAGLRVLRQIGAERVFAAMGTRLMDELAGAPITFVLRGIERPQHLPLNVTWRFGRGPFSVADERALLEEQVIDAVFCRNSGGEGARAKLDAARALGLPVVMQERPAAPDSASIADIESAQALIDQLFQG